MRLAFWKKEPIILEAPADKTLELMQLADDVTIARKNGGERVALCHLWNAIYDIFPETKIGVWHVGNSKPDKFLISQTMD